MKQLFVLLLLFIGFTGVSAQSKDTAGEFLVEAKKAAESFLADDTAYLLDLYSIYLSKSNITPQTIDKEHLGLYAKVVSLAVLNRLEIPDEIMSKALPFLKFNIEDKPENMNTLGSFYHYGIGGVDKDYTLAKQWYQKAIDNGDTYALVNLGQLYVYGENTNYTEGKSLFEQGVNRGNGAAMYEMGNLYNDGLGVKGDFTVARHWYELSAATGYANAMVSLARLYRFGNGVERDYNKAIYWLEKASETGSRMANYNLASYYEYGRGVEKDYSKAAYWLEKAANQGDSVSMHNLGRLYEIGGFNLESDINKSKEWYQKACEKGYRESCSKL